MQHFKPILFLKGGSKSVFFLNNFSEGMEECKHTLRKDKAGLARLIICVETFFFKLEFIEITSFPD